MKFEISHIAASGEQIRLKLEGGREFAKLYGRRDPLCRKAHDLIVSAPMLANALQRLLKEHESLIRSDYGGTGEFAEWMAELEYAREALEHAGVKP